MTGPDTGKVSVDVVGAGGIGVALAYALAEAGCDLRVVEADPRKLDAANDTVEISGAGSLHERPPLAVPFVAFEDWDPSPERLVLLATKTFDNARILARLDEDALLVPVQNGFDPELEKRAHAVEGIASFVSECEAGRARTRITRPGELHLGYRRPGASARERALVEGFAEALRPSGLFELVLVEDIRPYKHAKLMYNAAISPLAAAAGVDNGELLTDALAKKLFFRLIRENYAILANAGTELATIGPFHPRTVNRILATPGLPSIMALSFRPSLRGTYCSMAGDIEKGRTENDAYNGHLIRLAGDFPCPLNRAAHALIERLVKDGTPPARSHLEDLRPALAARS